MLHLSRYVTESSTVTGFNVVGAPETFVPGGSSDRTAFVFGSPHERLPFPDWTFHNVISMNIMEHVIDVEVGPTVQADCNGFT